MSYAMYGIEAFNEQEAATVCSKIARKVAEIQQIIDNCDDDVRPLVVRWLRETYPTQQTPQSDLALAVALQGIPNPFERQRLEMLRCRQANLPANYVPKPLLGGIFGSIL